MRLPRLLPTTTNSRQAEQTGTNQMQGSPKPEEKSGENVSSPFWSLRTPALLALVFFFFFLRYSSSSSSSLQHQQL